MIVVAVRLVWISNGRDVNSVYRLGVGYQISVPGIAPVIKHVDTLNIFDLLFVTVATR